MKMATPPELCDGFSERNDCVVRAFSQASGKPYADVHALMKSNGRRNRCSFRVKHMVARLGRELGLDLRQVKRSGTLAKLIAAHPNDVLIVRVAGHMFTVVDGHTNENVSRRVKGAWIATTHNLQRLLTCPHQ
jgi:hypothetical protein